jgi:hypothetical protein
VVQRVLERQGGDSAVVAAEECLAAANELNDKIKIVAEIAESLLRKFARESGAVICLTFATLADIVGHEILKVISGRSTLFRQFLAVGSMKVLPPQPIEFIPHNDRSDPYR